ncbi:anti-sigma factor domain-containing protein [Oceanobacillus bengalensis]|uniref:RsgI N-terminal anti-sigma domain-containing protein n=1 Tax=Oceanobacillus bengalensis TaxID=1435466 RepID=A0A494Z8A7_9BACI|nr:hypothetical protein [Oceanobacillus bengalensis]RKQ18767.1 hypothetical protein D8M05_01270 [Oceanobacillus bengalensis]
MKKGIMMEQHEDYAIFISKDGAIEKGRQKSDNAEIGMEVLYEPITNKQSIQGLSGEQKKALFPKVLTFTFILLLLAVPFYVTPFSNEVFAYVTVDINPSITLEINEDYHVKEIHANNSDALQIIKQIDDYKNKDIEEFIEQIMDRCEEAGLINEEKNILVGISFTTDEFPDNLSEIEDIEQHLLQNADWNIAAFHVPEEIKKRADEEKVSMNEMLAEDIHETALNELEIDTLLDEQEKEMIDSFYDEKEVEIMTLEKERDEKQTDDARE